MTQRSEKQIAQRESKLDRDVKGGGVQNYEKGTKGKGKERWNEKGKDRGKGKNKDSDAKKGAAA